MLAVRVTYNIEVSDTDSFSDACSSVREIAGGLEDAINKRDTEAITDIVKNIRDYALTDRRRLEDSVAMKFAMIRAKVRG